MHVHPACVHPHPHSRRIPTTPTVQGGSCSSTRPPPRPRRTPPCPTPSQAQVITFASTDPNPDLSLQTCTMPLVDMLRSFSPSLNASFLCTGNTLYLGVLPPATDLGSTGKVPTCYNCTHPRHSPRASTPVVCTCNQTRHHTHGRVTPIPSTLPNTGQVAGRVHSLRAAAQYHGSLVHLCRYPDAMLPLLS